MNNRGSRKLVILPAKPPPRKTKSVMKNEPDNHATLKINQRKSSVPRRQAEQGVFDELKRVDELNYALGRYDEAQPVNLKALKNLSHQA